MMKKRIIALMMLVVLCLAGCGEGVKLDENEVIVGNGTWQVTREDDVYMIMDNNVLKNEETLCVIDNIKEYKIFLLGEYLYVNTTEGAKQIEIESGKMKKFGSGDIVAARGRWIYYQSEDNKQKTMTLYKIDMKEGRQLMLFADTIVEVELMEGDAFYFKGISGNEYVNELSEDEGYFYSEWLGEDVTE